MNKLEPQREEELVDLLAGLPEHRRTSCQQNHLLGREAREQGWKNQNSNIFQIDLQISPFIETSISRSMKF